MDGQINIESAETSGRPITREKEEPGGWDTANVVAVNIHRSHMAAPAGAPEVVVVSQIRLQAGGVKAGEDLGLLANETEPASHHLRTRWSNRGNIWDCGRVAFFF